MSPKKKPKTSRVFKDKRVTVIGTEFEHGLTMALAKAASKAGGGKWVPPSEYKRDADVVVELDDAEDEEIQFCHARDIKLMKEKEFMDLVGLEANPAVKKPKIDPPLGKSKGVPWDGTLKTGIKVVWIGGHDSALSKKYRGCVQDAWPIINSGKLNGKIDEIATNWSHPERVPKRQELKDMEHADIVVKGGWFTNPGSIDNDKVKTMAARSLEAAEKMGCTLVDEESFYVAVRKFKEEEWRRKVSNKTGVSKAKGGSWHGTLKKGIKVFWIGGCNMKLGEKYFGVPCQNQRLMNKVNFDLHGEFSGDDTTTRNCTENKVPTEEELIDMENADIVVKGAWFTPGVTEEETIDGASLGDCGRSGETMDERKDTVRKIVANRLEAAEKMGCILVDEEAFYIAMFGKKH